MPPPRVSSATMTRAIPARLRRVCASAARKSTGIAVTCPPLIPAGPVHASVLLPRRSVVRPGARGDDGVRRFRGSRAFYVIEAYSRSLPARHWLVGAGRTGDIERRALASATPPRVTRRRVNGRWIELRRFAAYPAGGVNGGHVAAVARTGDRTQYVSVHGAQHADVAVAMLVALLEKGRA